MEEETEAVRDPDDLTKIQGVGPKIAETLVAAGSITFADVAKTEFAKWDELIADVARKHASTTWTQQPQLAADGK